MLTRSWIYIPLFFIFIYQYSNLIMGYDWHVFLIGQTSTLAFFEQFLSEAFKILQGHNLTCGLLIYTRFDDPDLV